MGFVVLALVFMGCMALLADFWSFMAFMVFMAFTASLVVAMLRTWAFLGAMAVGKGEGSTW